MAMLQRWRRPTGTARAAPRKVSQLVQQLRSGLEELEKGLLQRQLAKFLAGLLSKSASTSLEGFYAGAKKKLELIDQLETSLESKLVGLGEKAKKRYQRHIPAGSLKGRAFSMLLGVATKYDVRVGGFEGSVDMLLMALRRRWKVCVLYCSIDGSDAQLEFYAWRLSLDEAVEKNCAWQSS